jgi:hypothetical protein
MKGQGGIVIMADVMTCRFCGREFWWHDDFQMTNYNEHIATCKRDQEFLKKWKAERGWT